MTSPRAPTRPFQVLGVQQIAIGGQNRAALRSLWCDLLGVERTGEYESEEENVREDILTLGTGGSAVELDLMEPFLLGAKPRVDSPALHHIGIWVSDIHAAFIWLSAQGVRFTPGGIRVGASGHLVCFIHPKGAAEAPRSGEGVLIELVQAPASLLPPAP